MGVFFDDFERANGAPGGNWLAAQGSPAISGGTLGYSGHWVAYNSAVSDGNYQESVAHVYFTPNTGNFSGPAVKCAAASSLCYLARVSSSGGVYTFYITSRNATVLTTLASVVLSGTVPPYIKLAIKWDHGHLTATYQDSVTLECDDSVLAGQAYPGVSGVSTSTGVDDVRLVGSMAVGFAIGPSIIGNYGACVPITLTGSNTSWTPGTPGSPAFKVDHGTISTQTVLTATTATATYCPGTYLGPATFTDPSTGATAIATVTSDPTVVPPSGAYQFTPQAVNMVNLTAGEGWLERLLKPTTPIHTTGYADLELDTVLGRVSLNTGATVNPASLPDATLLYSLWLLINGGTAPAIGPQLPAVFSSLDTGLSLTKDAIDAIATDSHWNLGELLFSLGGNPVVSHKDIIDALSGIGGGSNQDVLDAIAAAKGDPLATIKAVLDQLFVLRTPTGYDLGDVLAAIAALPHTDAPSLTPVLNKLAQIQPSALVSLSTILDAMVGANTITNIVNVAIAALTGRAGSTVSGVIDLIGDLSSQVAAIAPVAAPLWPGVANARVSERVTLVDGLVVEGPLKGLLVDITSTPSGASAYIFGDVNSWKHSGGVIFQSDEGAYERAESLGLESQIIVPKTMEIASRAIFRTYPGWHGSVRSWNSGSLIQ